MDNNTKEINIVSYGAGQNSTAMIIEMLKRKIHIDEVIYSEVGNEMPETYIFLKEFKLYCIKKGLKFTEVKSKLGSIRDYYMENKIIPYRMFRQCTHKFKIIPINNYIRKVYGVKKPINMIMGIASDEIKRKDKIRGRKQFTYKFPLIDWEIDRLKCIEIIKKEGLSIPVKSGCYFCPFQNKILWKELFNNHNDLYEKSIEFEKNGRAYPEGNFMGNLTLEDFKKRIKEQTTLGDYKEDVSLIPCAYCNT